MKIAIIQARMGSTRLPGKILTDICGISMLERIVMRVRAAAEVDKIVVATTTTPEDDALVTWLAERQLCDVFRGSMDDVLDRYYRCAQAYQASIVIRVTADDPLKDPGIIDRAVRDLLAEPDLDYCSNTIIPTYPEGLDIEVFRFTALARAHTEAKLASEREHVTPYIWKHPELFRVKNFEHDRQLAAWRWTVDRPADLDFMRAVFGHFADRPMVPFQDVIQLLDAQPQLQELNANIARNEGYIKSIESENV